MEKLLKTIKKGLTPDENMDLKISLLEKRNQIQLEISNRKTRIQNLRDIDEMEVPAKVAKADRTLQKVLINSSSSFGSMMDAFVAKRNLDNNTNVSNPEVDALESEIEVLSELMETFPTVAEIKALGTKTKASK